jgi:hypothetical protein
MKCNIALIVFQKYTTMKKVIAILALMISLHQIVLAESPFNLGLKVGTNSSRISTNFNEITSLTYHTQHAESYFAGAFARIHLGRVYIQPEALFSTKEAQMSTDPNMLEVINHFEMKTIDVPVLIGFKLVDNKYFNFRFNGGPVFGFVNDSNYDLPAFSELQASDFVKNYIGWQVGVGVDFWFATLDARVEGTGNLIDRNSNFTMSQTLYSLALGIKIF